MKTRCLGFRTSATALRPLLFGSVCSVLAAFPLSSCGSDSTPTSTLVADASAEDGQSGVCTPQTCAQLGAVCGSAPDGCGGKVECGTCATGEFCGGGGPNKCGTTPCTPRTCMQVGASCGYASDQCSQALDCGLCPVPSTCGGSGVKNQCGCKPSSCTQLGASCGTVPDGCGGVLECGSCPSGQTCGGGGPNQCGTGSCTPKTCAQLGASCGYVSDACSQAIECGTCPSPDVCGGKGVLNQCSCLPKTCGQLGAACGKIANGCGAEIDCGGCPTGSTCGGGGTPNQCGGAGDGGSCGGCGPLEECYAGKLCVAKAVQIAASVAYLIDATEVTRKQYQSWLATGPSTAGQPDICSENTSFAPSDSCLALADLCEAGTCDSLPQECVDWCDARAYCAAVGKHLCGKVGGGANGFDDYSDANLSQWYRACSSGGLYNYPYGGSPSGDAGDGYLYEACNTSEHSGVSTLPVGSCPDCHSSVAGYEGVYDLSGNVEEWENCCDNADHCRVRGGSFTIGPANSSCIGGGFALGRTVVSSDVGIRCCATGQ